MQAKAAAAAAGQAVPLRSSTSPLPSQTARVSPHHAHHLPALQNPSCLSLLWGHGMHSAAPAFA